MTLNMLGFDKSKPYRSVKDFSSNRTVFIQDGKKYTEQGFPLIESGAVGNKYLCPQCDFGTMSAERLYEHSEKIHQASDLQVAVLKTYIQNINRGLPSDEGIDWARMKVTRTSAQSAHDEREEAERRGLPPAKVTADGFVCEMCPDLKPFKTKAESGRHRWNTHKLRKGN